MLRMIRIISIAAAVLLSPLHASSARAADPGAEPPPGPDHGKAATADATPVGAGGAEVEAAWRPARTLHGSGGFERAASAHSHSFALGVLYGVAEDVDVNVVGGFGYLVDRTDVEGPTRGSGASDLAFAARWRFLADARRALDLAVIATVVAPTGAEEGDDRLGLTQGYWSLRSALVGSKDWGRTTGNAELALTVPVGGGAGALDAGLSGNVALGRALLPWLQPLVELNYDVVLDETTHQRLAVTAGVNLSSQAGNRLLLGVQHAVWGRKVTQDTVAVVAMKTAF